MTTGENTTNGSANGNQIDLFFTPSEVSEERLKIYNVVVVDVLRAGTSIATALSNGARGVFPVRSIAEATALAEATGDQSLIALGIRYARALVRWGKAGFPTRTDEEVAAIVATCQTEGKCYDPDRKTCRVCGCCVGTKGLAVRNKAKMGTEHCPRKMW